MERWLCLGAQDTRPSPSPAGARRPRGGRPHPGDSRGPLTYLLLQQVGRHLGLADAGMTVPGLRLGVRSRNCKTRVRGASRGDLVLPDPGPEPMCGSSPGSGDF